MTAPIAAPTMIGRLLGWVDRRLSTTLGRTLVGLALVALVGVWVIPGLPALVHWQGADAEVYVLGGRAWLQGESIYGFLHRGLPFTYPPFAAELFAPLALFPELTGARAAIVLSAVAYLLSLWVVVHTSLGERNSFWRAALLTVVTFPLYPVMTAVVNGQVDTLIMLLVLADVLLPARRRPRGVLIGLAAAIKLTPAAFALYLLLNKDYRAVLTSALSAIGFTLLGTALAWRDSLVYWPGVFESSRVGVQEAALNQSLAGVIARATTATPLGETWRPLWLVACVVALGFAIVGMRRALQGGSPALALGINAVLGLLVSPISWAHHWVWCVPIMVTLATLPLPFGRLGPRLLAAIGVPVFLIAPHWLLGTFHDVPGSGPTWGPLQQVLGSAMTWWGVAVLTLPLWDAGLRKASR